MGDSRNADYIERNFAVESRLTKAALAPADKPRSSVRFYLQTYRALKGTELAVSTTVLDFGCAFGSVVDVLLGAGYDAYGVDILEYWGKDEELCGEIIVHYPAEVKSRLKLLDAETSRVPFSDDSFEVVVSDQVLEHVFDLRSAFREQARVLKPGFLWRA